ncbi:hypothetical protein PMAYCL1PPCAC_13358, partial [Pristionchus mayeri]
VSSPLHRRVRPSRGAAPSPLHGRGDVPLGTPRRTPHSSLPQQLVRIESTISRASRALPRPRTSGSFRAGHSFWGCSVEWDGRGNTTDRRGSTLH